MKDHFSSRSDQYARFRPSYPDALLEVILSLIPGRHCAWDCGTGNGQMAALLTAYFDTVCATDISSNQLTHAFQHPQIHYSLQPAEKTDFKDSCFDLIIVAQAIHWFDFEGFYREVRRTLKPEGLLAVTGYGLIRSAPAINEVIDHFYREIVGPYWPAERHYIDENYRTIPFPLREIDTPALQIHSTWSLEQLLGYIGTWSAVKHYEQRLRHSPLALLEKKLQDIWTGHQEVSFPILLRLGKLH